MLFWLFPSKICAKTPHQSWCKATGSHTSRWLRLGGLLETTCLKASTEIPTSSMSGTVVLHQLVVMDVGHPSRMIPNFVWQKQPWKFAKKNEQNSKSNHKQMQLHRDGCKQGFCFFASLRFKSRSTKFNRSYAYPLHIKCWIECGSLNYQCLERWTVCTVLTSVLKGHGSLHETKPSVQKSNTTDYNLKNNMRKQCQHERIWSPIRPLKLQGKIDSPGALINKHLATHGPSIKLQKFLLDTTQPTHKTTTHFIWQKNKTNKMGSA